MGHLAARGWVCVTANYRLSPQATWPDHIVDVKRALAWTKANIAGHGGDPGFVVITGGSAGGHLCALAYADGIAMRDRYFDVRDGAETRGDLELIAGVAVRIDVLDANGRAVGERVESEIVDAAGRTLDTTPLVADQGPARWSRRLAPGRHEIRVHDRRGRTGALEFEVPRADDGAPVRFSVTLR